jgi:hypothetical protein
MNLRTIGIQESPLGKNRVRLSGEISYDNRDFQREWWWFDVPAKSANYLSDTGNPWLACLIPLAVTLGEPLRIYKPVDRLLFESAHELMAIWKRWYPDLKIIPIEAELADDTKPRTLGKAASFFSGGVDSFFTALRHSNQFDWPGRVNIDDLLSVWGFDIPLSNREAFNRMRDVMQKAALDLGRELVDVATNIRDTRWWSSGYGRLSHGPALASIGLFLEKKYSQVLIPSTQPYDNLMPNGSHPLTDPLLSTNSTKIIHDGAGFDRVEKTELVSKSDIAMRSLRVCWASQSDKNCQACNKCYRTMITLMLLGALNRCSTFSEANLEISKIQRIYSEDDNDRTLLREVQTLANRTGNRDVARALEKSFKRSTRMSRYLRIIRRYKTKPFIWRLEHYLLSKSLT